MLTRRTTQALTGGLAVIFVATSTARTVADDEDLYQSALWRGTPCERVAGKAVPEGQDVAAVSKDLPAILAAHETWLGQDKAGGTRADLSFKHLDGIDLYDGVLAKAKLSGSSLASAFLVDAKLDEADLLEADLSSAELDRAVLRGADLRGATLDCASLKDADLENANLTCNYDEARTKCTSLMAADLRGTKLAGVKLEGADLSRAIYEPKSHPEAADIAAIRGLETLTYETRADGLFILRKRFRDAGFDPQARAVTYALNRREAQLDTWPERWFKTVAFDWASQYGMSPGRPLRIFAWSFVISWAVYAILLRFSRSSKIYRVDEKRSVRNEERSEQIKFKHVVAEPKQSYLARRLAEELSLVRWAGVFSLRSAFNIGFQEIHLGKWLRLLTRVEFELRSEGWIRSMSGVQALVSMYLVALWVLVYFGHPFE